MELGLLWIVVGVVATLAVLPLLAFGMQRSRHQGPTAYALGTAFEHLDGLFNPGRLRDIEQRRHEAAMPEEQRDGAPPRTRIDLDHRRAVVHLPASPRAAAPQAAAPQAATPQAATPQAPTEADLTDQALRHLE